MYQAESDSLQNQLAKNSNACCPSPSVAGCVCLIFVDVNSFFAVRRLLEVKRGYVIQFVQSPSLDLLYFTLEYGISLRISVLPLLFSSLHYTRTKTFLALCLLKGMFSSLLGHNVYVPRPPLSLLNCSSFPGGWNQVVDAACSAHPAHASARP